MKQVEYKIYTEAKPGIDKIVGNIFEAFTINIGTGYWKGVREGSAQITILCDDSPNSQTLVRQVSLEIKKQNKQECVLITKNVLESEIIGG